MKITNFNRKGQSLPLNTIVIAILVIIVLLVIIVFFTSKIGETGSQLDKQSISQCNTANPALATLYPSKSDGDFVEEAPTDMTQYTKVVGVDNCWVRK